MRESWTERSGGDRRGTAGAGGSRGERAAARAIDCGANSSGPAQEKSFASVVTRTPASGCSEEAGYGEQQQAL